jgi:DNA-binding FrmR family transcriptional regulator
MEKFTGVLFEMETTLSGKYPEIPIAETVISELGSSPLFVTLPLGAIGAKSLNGRRYNKESVEAIADAINTEKSIGQKGHLRDDERPYVFEIPPLMWLGAKIDDKGKLWGKAFVLESFPEVREYVRVAKLTNARIGTSIYGTGEIDEDGTVHNLKIESIDLAHPGRLGVPIAAAVPMLTAETYQGSEAARLTPTAEAHDEDTPSRTEDPQRQEPETPTPVAEAEKKTFKVGDWVGWEKEGRLIRGKVNTVWTEGDVEVPGADELVITATPENPVARMDVYEPSYQQPGKWQTGWQQVVHYFSSLTAIEPLSESQIINRTEDGGDMPTIQEMESEITTLRQQLAEAKRQHTEETRKLKTDLSEMEGQIADFKSVAELLSNPQDVVVAVQALQADNKSLRRENGDLLQESIKLQVAEKVKVEAVRPVIEQMVRDRKPARRVDVTTALEDALQQDYVKTLLKIGVQESMGPAHQRPANTPEQAAEEEQFIIIPEVN